MATGAPTRAWVSVSTTTTTTGYPTCCHRSSEPEICSIPKQRRWKLHVFDIHDRSGWDYPASFRLGSEFLDYDNDGWKDLFIAKGMTSIISTHQPAASLQRAALLMHNDGKRFTDVSAEAGPVFQEKWVEGRGLATGDLDNDGRVDAVVSTNGGLLTSFATKHHRQSLADAESGWPQEQSGRYWREIKATTASGSQCATVRLGSYLSSSDHGCISAWFGKWCRCCARNPLAEWDHSNLQRRARRPDPAGG